jgi:hypothetical protein
MVLNFLQNGRGHQGCIEGLVAKAICERMIMREIGTAIRRWRRPGRRRLAREAAGGRRRWNLQKHFHVGDQQVVNLGRHLCLVGGDLLDDLPQRGEVYGYLLHLLGVEERGGPFRRDPIHSRLRNCCRLRRLRYGRPCSSVFGTGRRLRPAKLLDPARDRLLRLRRPAKLWSSCRDYLLRGLAVRLESQGSRDTGTNREQVSGEPPRSWSSSGSAVDDLLASGKIGFRKGRYGSHRHVSFHLSRMRKQPAALPGWF